MYNKQTVLRRYKMCNLFYRIRLDDGVPMTDLSFRSQHPFPSPIGTELNLWYGDGLDRLFRVNVSFYSDNLKDGVMLMWLDDGSDDPMNIDHPDKTTLIEDLLKQGWKREPRDY